MSTHTLTRISALALSVLGAGLALTTTAAPANAAFSWEGQNACTALAGTYANQIGSNGDILQWTCTYTGGGDDTASMSLRAACSGNSSNDYSSAGETFTCSPITGPTGYLGYAR